MNMQTSRSRRGFTMIELMVVIAVTGILLALVAPSFVGTIARKKLEGVGAELHTDLQYARSEAVQRNAAVRVFVESGCYVVLVAGTSDPTSCTSLGTGASQLKLVNSPTGSGITFSFAPAASSAYMEFEPVRGMARSATDSSLDRSGDVTVQTTKGNWQIKSVVTKQGRVKSCSPNNTITSLATDCS